jgi:hypothetical protein
MYPKNLIFQFPSGRWGFVGHVDAQLSYVNKDGTEIDSGLAARLVGASNPAMIVKGRSWESRQAAIDFAKALGLEVTEE